MDRCDNKSVGVIIENEHDQTLLISRARYPFGWAAPAGHVDRHGSAAKTAVEEVYEETGLVLREDQLSIAIQGLRVNNTCRRPGGGFHDWTVYTAHTSEAHLNPNPDEALCVSWVPNTVIAALAITGTKHGLPDPLHGDLALEPIWARFFSTLRR